MFSFFRRSKKTEPVFDFIGADMHNHLLPGIDDGSPNAEESLLLLKGMMELGYERFYCTPHVITGVHPNTPETIGEAHNVFVNALKQEGIPVQVGFSAEYMINYDFDDIIREGKLIPLPGNHVLVEMSYAVESPNLREVIFELQTKGFRPILAHPERYNFLHNRFDRYEEILYSGADFQLNILSLSGYYGKPVQKIAEKLLAADFISWVGTDLHHQRHLQGLKDLAQNKKALKMLEGIKELKNREWLQA